MRKIALLPAWLAAGALILASLACGLPLLPPPGAASPTAATTAPAGPAPSAAATAPAQAPTPSPSVTVDPPAAASPTPPGIQVDHVVIYLVALDDNGASGTKIGCGDSLVAVRRPVAPTRLPLLAALNELLALKSEFYGESGLYNGLWQSNLRVQSAEVRDGTATVALVGQVRLGGTCDTPRFQAQVEETIRAASGAETVTVFLNGVAIQDALSQQ